MKRKKYLARRSITKQRLDEVGQFYAKYVKTNCIKKKKNQYSDDKDIMAQNYNYFPVHKKGTNSFDQPLSNSGICLSYARVLHRVIVTANIRFSQSKYHRYFYHQIENCSLYPPAECTVRMSWIHYSFIGHQFLYTCMLCLNFFTHEI